MDRKSSISQLDLLLLGRRGITSRISGVERTVRELTLARGGEGAADDGLVRPNLLLNSSFEFYNRNATYPNDWVAGGPVALAFGISGADGSTAISCGPGGYVTQEVAGSLTQPKSAVVLSVAAKSNNYGARVLLEVTHGPGVALGPVYRIDPDGNEVQTTEVPGDGEWYRFWRPALVNGGAVVFAQVGSDGSSTANLFLDAAKYEKEDGVTSFIEPSAFIGGDWGASVHLRNLSADNIIAGTLTVGGSSSNNPRISVKDGSDVEIVTIGDPNAGYYGIEVKEAAGIRVAGSGSIEVIGGGNVVLDNGSDLLVKSGGFISVTGGSVNVSGAGGINVSGGGSINVTGGGNVVVNGGLVNVIGSGAIRAGTSGAQRIDITAAGIAGYNNANQEQVRISSADGKMRVLGPGAVSVEGGGSLIAGTPGAARVELNSGGIFAYNAQNEETVGLSTADGTLTIDADALIVEGTAVFEAITVSGAVTILQDLTLGANVLFVDTSGQRVGINRAPDAQFDLDVNGSIRAGGYIVGKMALQLSDALLIAHYDGSTKAGDTTGDPTGHRGQPATITGTVTYAAAKFNKGIDTTNGYVSYASNGNISNSAGTVMLWLRPSAVTNERNIFTYGTPGTNGFLLRQNNGAVNLEWYTPTVSRSTSSVLVANNWTHLAVTWGGGTVRLYVNGALAIEEAGSFTAPASNATLVVGSRPGMPNFAGLIDDLAILGVAADAALIRAVYESNAPVFAETSNWAFRTANTLAWADEEGLWARSATGAEAFGVSGVNGKSWGNIGQNLDAGDVLIGNTTNYLFWDASAGTMAFRGNGAGLTSINGSNITTGSITADKLNVSSLSAISANIGNVTAGNITGVTITGSTVQAGGGKVRLDSAGITIGASQYTSYTFNETEALIWKRTSNYSTNVARIQGYWSTAYNWLDIRTPHTSTNGTGIDITADGSPYWSRIRMSGGDGGSILLQGSNIIVTGQSGFGSGKLIVEGSIGFVQGSNTVISQSGSLLSYPGPISIGTTGSNYWFNTSNWSTGGPTLLLNGADYTSIGFHDANSRVDAIIAGGGWIRIGTNVGWGAANIELSGGHTYISGSVTTPTNAAWTLGAGATAGIYTKHRLRVTSETWGNDSYSVVAAAPDNYTGHFWARGDGYLWANRSWAIPSDEVVKEDIQDLPNRRAEMKRVKFRKFKRKADGRSDIGVVAQELREVFPELITEVDAVPGHPAAGTQLAVDYNGLAIIQGKALQELDDDVDQLRRQMRQQIEQLEAKVAALEVQLGPKQK